MMKCIEQISTGKIVRTNNGAAELQVASGNWKYTSKKEWKEKVRDREK